MFIVLVVFILILICLAIPKLSPTVNERLNDPKLEYLRSLLNEHSFKKADEETLKIMRLSTHPNTSDGMYSPKDALNFPNKDLITKIDKLWLEKTDGKFGFSVQRNTWINLGGTLGEYNKFKIRERFFSEVGWKRGLLDIEPQCPQNPDPEKQGSFPCQATLFYKFYTLNQN
ncbi:GUN4 domain-containing protein [Scytonema sp. HK-05]|uniref:GUN4 domain-containing protein n=1 Tax=Scytonema sp. HK-05 TaxID=1137095 RepID=UPI000935C7EB|nr:GUN4 domain-containing protein [Scytonema sp. HK-05]OKH58086.1 hypothetical protein NIES2130_16355 [Scytonema sp. HK-05]